MKFALTEEAPLVSAAKQTLWAEIPDAKSSSIASSLAMLKQQGFGGLRHGRHSGRTTSNDLGGTIAWV